MIDYYMIAAMGASALYVVTLLLHFVDLQKMTIWHAFAIGAVAGFAAMIANNYLALAEWLKLGIMGVSTGALIFTIGMLAMISVMVFNLMATRGKRLVR